MKCLYWSHIHPTFAPELVEIVGPHILNSDYMAGWVKIRYTEGLKEGDEKTVLATELYCEGEEQKLEDDMSQELLRLEDMARDCAGYFKQLEFVGVPAQRKWINDIAKGIKP